MSDSPILTVTREGVTVKACPLEGEILLGRAEGCAIRLDDRAISRQHAYFRITTGGIQVEKKSEFATLSVNGAECTRAIVKEGDIIAIGPYSIRVSLPEAAPVAVTKEIPVEVEPPEKVEGAEDPAFSENAPAEPGSEVPEGLEAAEPVENPDGAVPDFEAPAVALDSPSPSEPSSVDIADPLNEDGKTKVLSATKVIVQLIFKPGTANVAIYDIKKDVIKIGRGKNCDVILLDKKSSRENSIIKRSGMNFIIQDLNSSNGTFLNGVKVTEAEISGGDRIKIGNVEFEFRASSSDYEKQAPNFMSLPVEEELPEPDFSAPSEVVGGLPKQEPFVADVGGIPGIPGITGIGGGPGKKTTLVEKFKALPKRTQMIAGVAGALLAYWLMTGEEEIPDVKKKNISKKPVATATATPAEKVPANFESLPPEKKAFVEAQHSLSFDLYKNKEYDKALFEIQKIFTIIPDYKDAREIERYAKEGKRKAEAIAEEQRKKDDDARFKAKVAALIEETKEHMHKKEYDLAKELFSQVLSLEPDNALVATWKKEIEADEEQKQMLEQQKQVQLQINQRGWDLFKEANGQKKAKHFHQAIETFQKAIDVGASDPKLKPLAKKLMAQCRWTIVHARDPVLQEAAAKEAAGEFTTAFALFKKATRIDPPHPAGYAGMNRIRGILHDRAKAIYTEAILAESYSDFAAAKKLFQDCLNAAPPDDIYHDRAARKLAHYFRKDEVLPQ